MFANLIADCPPQKKNKINVMFIEFSDNMFTYGANGWWYKMNIKCRNSSIDNHS